MPRRVGPLPYRKVERLLRERGFEPIRQRGSHVFFRHPDGRTTVVPHHAGSDLPPGLVRKVLSDAGISPDELR